MVFEKERIEVVAMMEPEATEGEFLLLSELVARSGVNERTVRRRLRERDVALWTAGWDIRRRLVKREDVARLLEPQPVDAPAV